MNTSYNYMIHCRNEDCKNYIYFFLGCEYKCVDIDQGILLSRSRFPPIEHKMCK